MAGAKLKAEIIEVLEDGNRIAKFSCEGSFYAVLDEIADRCRCQPYITKKLEDKERYQTVYSNEIGSAAAPTAGLHFTQEQLDELKAMGVSIGRVTLHVGLGNLQTGEGGQGFRSQNAFRALRAPARNS